MSLPASDHEAPAASRIGGQGSDLVLLHGLGGTWEMWKPVIPALEARHRVIALTLPGHYGGPDYRGDGDASVAGLADQLIETLRAQGIRQAHVAGNSLGGWLSIELARRGFARSVTAFSPAGGWRTDNDYRAISIRFRIAFALIGVILFVATLFSGSTWLRKVLTKQTMEHGERLSAAEFLASLRAMAQTRIFVPLLRTMGRDGPVAPLDPGRVPVRVAWGGCDATQPVVALRHHRAAARGLQGRGQGGRGLGQRLLPVRPVRRLSAQPPSPTPSCSCSACARASTKCSPSANPTRRNRSPRARWPASRRARPPRQPGKRNDH